MGDIIIQTDGGVLLLPRKKKKSRKVYATTECQSYRKHNEKMKRVTFATDDQLCQVIYLSDWVEESREARKGTWIMDRLWFQRRVRYAEQNIGWVFQTQHRMIIQRKSMYNKHNL